MWAPIRRTAPPRRRTASAPVWPVIVAPVRASTLQVSRSAASGGSAGCSSRASGQADESQPGTPGEDALLQQAISQLKVDICREVLQIKPAGDPCPAKPQPARVRVGRQPPPQNVADHRRRARPGLPQDRIAAPSTASPSAARSSHSPRPTCSTSDCSTEVNPPRGS